MAPEFNLSNFQNCVKDLLQQYGFDFDKFTEGQERLLFNYMSGHDCVGVLPTNYGKSLIFHLVPGLVSTSTSTHTRNLQFLLLFFQLLLWLKIKLRGVQK